MQHVYFIKQYIWKADILPSIQVILLFYVFIFLLYIYTLFRNNAAQYTINTIHHYAKLKRYTNTHDKTKVRE